MLRLIPLPTLTTREYEQASGFPARKEEETIKVKGVGKGTTFKRKI
jgi:hypothetical protein